MSVSVSLAIVIFTLFLYWCYGIYKKNKMLEKLPGPLPIPFIGVKLPSETYGFFDFIDELTKKYGKTCKLYLGDTLQILTCDINIIEPLMKSSQHIKKSVVYYLYEPWLKEGLIVSHGQKWKHRRKICNTAFTFSMLQDYFNIFKKATDIIVRKLGEEADKGVVINAIDYTSKLALDIVGETSFGVNLNIQEGNSIEYIEAVADFTEIGFMRNFSAWKRFDLPFKWFCSETHQVQQKAIHTLNSTVMKIIRERRQYYKNKRNLNEKDNGEKVKSILIDALMQQDDMTDEDIREEVNNFLFAGHDTTSAAMAFAIFELSKSPKMQQRLFEEITSYVGNDFSRLTADILQEMKYLDMVVKEILRLRTPVPIIERQLEDNALIGETLIPKGTVITILLYWLHHDSDLFPDPETFDPERFNPENQEKREPFAFVPFSAGLRNCIGQKYGVLEMKTVIARIVFEFTIHPVDNFKLVLGMSSILRSKHGTPIKLKRRK